MSDRRKLAQPQSSGEDAFFPRRTNLGRRMNRWKTEPSSILVCKQRLCFGALFPRPRRTSRQRRRAAEIGTTHSRTDIRGCRVVVCSASEGYHADLVCLTDESDTKVGPTTVKRRRCILPSEDESGPSDESMENRAEQHPAIPPPEAVQVSGRSRQANTRSCYR